MALSDEELAVAFLFPSRLRTFTDEDLMAALRMGCNDPLTVLFERRSALVFRIARAILHTSCHTCRTMLPRKWKLRCLGPVRDD
jgi:hypothetical protein